MSGLQPSLDTYQGMDSTLISNLPIKRRQATRYPCGLSMTTDVQLDVPDSFRRVVGENISQGGMAVILSECPEVGTVVNLRMHGSTSANYEMSARIVHVSHSSRGQWLVGLAFSRQLTMAELASLL